MKDKPDTILFLTLATLILLGISVLGSVSPAYSQELFGQPDYLLRHQLFWGFLPGSLLALLAFLLPLPFLKRLAFWFFLLTLLLSVLPLLSKFGLKFLGAARWLDLGLVSLQPSEFLKLGLILYLASWFSKKEPLSGYRKERGILVALRPLLLFSLVIAAIALLLTLQPDISTLGIIVLTAAVMFFLARTALWQNFLLWLAGLASLFLLIRAAPYRLNRLLVFLNPDFDPLGHGYQLKQSLIAIGSGGLFGLGLGLSRQKFGFLPQTIGDAIFPVFAEETGFLGAVVLVLLFLVLLWRGLHVGSLARDEFARLAATGIPFWLGGQALINICSMSGLLPLTGLPLPFISYGGSHLVAELIGVGILLNISRLTRHQYTN